MASAPSSNDNGDANPNTPRITAPPTLEALKKRARYFQIGEWIAALGVVSFLLGSGVIAQQLLVVRPYEPVFWIFVICVLLHFYNVALLTTLWLGFSVKLRARIAAGGGEAKAPALPSAREYFTGWQFWLCLISSILVCGAMFAVVHFIHPESFFNSSDLQLVRLGSVTHDTAALWVRDPTASTPLGVEYRVAGSTADFTMSSNTVVLAAVADYAGSVRLTGLAPATEYEWRFNTSTPVTRKFKTFPVPGTPSKFTFYFGSCFMNFFPAFTTVPGFKFVHDRNPDLFIFLGDFVYSDLPYYRGDRRPAYDSLYRQSLKNPFTVDLLQAIPNYFMLDDHEAINDWPDVRRSTLQTATEPFEDAANSWYDYLGNTNPKPSQPDGAFAYEFSYGDSAFFVLDTRSNRTSYRTNPEGPGRTLLGSNQKAWLFQWLLDQQAAGTTFKFLMVPVPLTTLFPDTVDSFGGYATERAEILAFLKTNGITGAVFLTGDSHLSYAVELGGNGTGIFELSSSPISAFDSSIGGYYSRYPWVKDHSVQNDTLRWFNVSNAGHIMMSSHVRVDTTVAVPTVEVDFYDHDKLIHTEALNVDMLVPA